MKKSMRRLYILTTAVLLICLLGGCGMFAQPDLTEEQSELIAEYAAGVLRQYDRNEGSLKEFDEDMLKEEPETPEEPVQEESVVDEPETEEQPETEDTAEEAAPVSAENEQPQVVYSDSFADAIGIDGFDIAYTDYEVCNSYPKSEDGSWSISMSARRGKKLVVLHFNITNSNDADTECDILHQNKSYRLLLNDTRINEQVTVLLNSMSQYCDVIPAGATEDAILIFEADEEAAENIESMDLIIKDDHGSDRFQIK